MAAPKHKGKFRSVRSKDVDSIDKTIASTKDNQSNNNKRVNFTAAGDVNIDISPSIHTHSAVHDLMSSSSATNRDYLRLNGSIPLSSTTSSSHQRNPSQSVMVRLKRLDTLRLNQRIKVKDYGYGSIQFLGCVHFAQGLFVGVELDEAKGKHDGSYHGKRYFTAKDKHGVLVKQHRVELLDIEDNNATHSNMESDFLNGLDLSNFDELLGLNEIDEITHENDEDDNDTQSEKKNAENEKLNLKLKELQRTNQSLNHKIEEYMKSADDLEEKISNLETENLELKDQKEAFEDEMHTKIEQLEQQLKEIHSQLRTKDEVLRKQIGSHENTKNKFRKKIREHDALKSKNQDTVQVILYGDNAKDEIISQLKKKEKKYQMQSQQHIIELEHVDMQTKERLNQRIEQWLFDYDFLQ